MSVGAAGPSQEAREALRGVADRLEATLRVLDGAIEDARAQTADGPTGVVNAPDPRPTGP